ncbi:4796_t:CDS:10 [Paraglomus occultum]|uniref:CTP synthase n=1 Tax=Paraglomus occultum TaxID=144539 RepID=A0A9N9F3B1_9GLOM|nr:4796_t:CDS:10 [Paraglomus occultum]
MKYVLILGGVISGIGKGVIASSTGLLLKTLGLKVTAIKIDPYINVDAGTMNPIEHGEVFVLNDGAEVDLDLGNYERFLDVTLTRDNNITSGKIFQHVIEKERRGDYLGKNVQTVPQITDAIQSWIERVARIPVDKSGEIPDICIIELGGTIGDFESAPYIEALRQFQYRVGQENFAVIQVSLVPVLGVVGEQKTKPTQATIRQLRALGLKPDLIACRCSEELEARVRSKIALYCRVELEQVLSVQDVASTYHVPLLLKDQGILNYLTKRFRLDCINITPEWQRKGSNLLRFWKKLTVEHSRSRETVTIVLVGKYTYLQDSYISVVQALEHASIECGRKLVLKWVEASDLEAETKETNAEKYEAAWDTIRCADGILVPGGFGNRGTEGKIAAVRYAREKKVPFLGICLGLQVAVIEFARHVCGIENANSEELDAEAVNKLVVYMPEISRTHLGGTMRLGLRPTRFTKESEGWCKIRKIYEAHQSMGTITKEGSMVGVKERHRHRYEVNPEYIPLLAENGLTFVGRDETGKRMEILELPDHPFFVGTQYHPEYLSRPLRPVPTFLGFVAASAGLPLSSLFSKHLPN